VVAGGLLGALATSSCCVLPLVLFSIGAGGGWIGKLTALARYQPVFQTGFRFGPCLAK
jgi:mercuric ion transport protein